MECAGRPPSAEPVTGTQHTDRAGTERSTLRGLLWGRRRGRPHRPTLRGMKKLLILVVLIALGAVAAKKVRAV